jgi:O-Antigen ligase
VPAPSYPIVERGDDRAASALEGPRAPRAEAPGARLAEAVRRWGVTVGVALAVFGVAFQSGGYDVTVRNAFAIAGWWAIAVAVAAVVWPVERPPRAALVAGGALAALLVWTSVAISWSDSAERAFTEVNRIAFYLAVFTLVVLASRRGSGGRWADGLAVGIAATGLLGLVSRLFPDLIGDRGVSSFFPGGIRYLGYPLDYWNGLGIFVGLGVPQLLRIALDARSTLARAVAVGVTPALLGTLYLTSSRGGMATAALGTVVFIALCRDRLRALVAVAVAGTGGAAAAAVLAARSELADGRLQSPAVAGQGRSAGVLIAGICLLAGVVYRLVARASVPIPRIRVPRLALAAGALLLVAAAVIAAKPAERFESFKQPPRNPFARVEGAPRAAASAETPRVAPASSHLLSSTGNGRWQFWGAAADEFETRPLLGRGPGSYEAWWARHGSVSYFTRHAHSLYLETLGELGVVGLALLLALLVTGLVAGARRLRPARYEERNVIAALVAVLSAFAFAAAIDWIWQLPAVTVVAVVALALLVGPATATAMAAASPPRRLVPIAARAGAVVAALCLIVAQGIPFFTQNDIRRSQQRFAAGDLAGARAAALSARSVQPWAASPHLQLALVEERRGDLAAARAAISKAIDRDPLDWRLWLTSARLDDEAGLASDARAKVDRAVALNPRSPLFASIRRTGER